MDANDLLKRPQRWASVLRWATIAGVELAIVGPFGSFKANIYSRLAYWLVLCWAGSLALWPSIIMALTAGSRRGFPPLFCGTAAVLVISGPLAALAASGCYLFWPVHASGIRVVEWYALTVVVLLPSAAGLLWLELAHVTFPFKGTLTVSTAQRSSRDCAVPNESGGAALPDHLIAGALCLQMEDHYIRVHTCGRSHLHLGVMREVISGMDKDRGLQVHRSWWVAQDAVSSWYRGDRSVVLMLVNGLQVPVARNRLAVLRSRGWLLPEREDSPRPEEPSSPEQPFGRHLAA